MTFANVLLRKAGTLIEVLHYHDGLALRLSEPSFEPGPFRVCSRLRSAGVIPGTVFDVGANVGQFALAACKCFPAAQVHSYEPLARAYRELEGLASRYPRISPQRAALGRAPGRLKLVVTSNLQSSSLLRLHRNHREAYPDVVDQGIEDVDVRTLVGELGERTFPEPMLLKLDVQGYESESWRAPGRH